MITEQFSEQNIFSEIKRSCAIVDFCVLQWTQFIASFLSLFAGISLKKKLRQYSRHDDICSFFSSLWFDMAATKLKEETFSFQVTITTMSSLFWFLMEQYSFFLLKKGKTNQIIGIPNYLSKLNLYAHI